MGGVSLRVICGFQLNASFFNSWFPLLCIDLWTVRNFLLSIELLFVGGPLCTELSYQAQQWWTGNTFKLSIKSVLHVLVLLFPLKKRTFVLRVSTHITQCRSPLAELRVSLMGTAAVFHFIGQQVTKGLKKGSEGGKWERSSRHKLSLCFNLVGRNRWFGFTLFLLKSFPGHQ